jgi:DNA-binding GntR family transcriptional regulator
MPIVLGIIENLWNRVSPYLHIYLRISDQPGGNPEVRETLGNHERILRGMMLQDPNEAAEGVRNDITTSSQVVLRLLRRRG